MSATLVLSFGYHAPTATCSADLSHGIASARHVSLSSVRCGTKPVPGNAASGEASRRIALLSRMLFLCFLAMALACALLGSIAVREKADTCAQVETTTVVVHEGDCLWNIAEEHGIEGLSTPEVVTWITRENSLPSPLLKPGESLVVPAFSLGDTD